MAQTKLKRPPAANKYKPEKNPYGVFRRKGQGYIRVANADFLDYESMPQFDLTIVIKELYGPNSDTATVTINLIDIDDATSIYNAADQNKLKIYPNPTTGVLFLDVLDNSMKISEIEIINITGMTVYHKAESKEQVDVSGFAKGLYFVKVRVNEKMYVQKMILLK